MSDRAEWLDTELDWWLKAAAAPGSPNQLSASELRALAVEYLAEMDAEKARFPQIAAQPHWTLWSADYQSEDALFAVLTFRSDGMEFICGTGDGESIRDWSTNYPASPDGLIEELRTRFRLVGPSLAIDRQVAERWLGRCW